MIDAEFVELINMEIDGVLSSRDRAKLRSYLESNPEAAEYYGRLNSTVAAIESVSDPEPPAHLEEKILAAVPFGHYPTAASARGFGARVERWFLALRLQYAAVFIFGIVFGLLVYSAISYDDGNGAGGLESGDFWGTMGQISKIDGMEPAGKLDVDFNEVTGKVSFYEHGAKLVADVSLASSDEIEWTLDGGTANVSFDGYRSISGSSGNVVASGTGLRVLQTGEAHYLLFFTHRDHPMEPLMIRIFSADQLLLERSLTTAAN
jgi:hypothetical protein